MLLYYLNLKKNKNHFFLWGGKDCLGYELFISFLIINLSLNKIYPCPLGPRDISTIANDTKLLSSDLKTLHSIFIKELYKDRKAPVKPFDNNLILATCEGARRRADIPKFSRGEGRVILDPRTKLNIKFCPFKTKR
jgi:hypothetical protein